MTGGLPAGAAKSPALVTSAVLTQEYVAEYCRLAGHPVGEQGPEIVPPTVASAFTYPLLAALPPTEGTVLVRQEFDVFAAAKVGTMVTAAVEGIERYEKAGRRFMVVSIEVRAAGGVLLLRSRVTRLLPEEHGDRGE